MVSLSRQMVSRSPPLPTSLPTHLSRSLPPPPLPPSLSLPSSLPPSLPLLPSLTLNHSLSLSHTHTHRLSWEHDGANDSQVAIKPPHLLPPSSRQRVHDG
jgi:hypothetical protein